MTFLSVIAKMVGSALFVIGTSLFLLYVYLENNGIGANQTYLISINVALLGGLLAIAGFLIVLVLEDTGRKIDSIIMLLFPCLLLALFFSCSKVLAGFTELPSLQHVWGGGDIHLSFYSGVVSGNH